MYMFFPLLPMRLAAMFRPIYLLFLNKWYFDELYDAVLVQPLIRLARASGRSATSRSSTACRTAGGAGDGRARARR